MLRNRSAERILLASIMKFPTKYFQYEPFLSIEDFSSSTHQEIFRVLQSIYSSGIDTVIDSSKINAHAEHLGISDFDDITNNCQITNDMLESSVTIDDADEYFKLVKRSHLIDKLSKDCTELKDYVENTTDSVNTIIDKTQEKILSNVNTLAGRNDGVIKLSDGMWSLIDSYADNPGEPGLDIGLPIFQKAIGGITNGTMTFIAATQKTGKSFFGLYAALYVAKKYNIPVLYCDSEMTEEEQQNRACAAFMKIPFDEIRGGLWGQDYNTLLGMGVDPDDAERLVSYRDVITDQQLREEFDKLPIYYYSINGKTVKTALPFLRQWAMQYRKPCPGDKVPNCLIIWDYIKLNSAEEIQGNIKDYQAIGFTCGTLKNFASEYCLPILTFGQTNRERERGFKQVAGSNKIVELSSSISLLYKKSASDRMNDPDGNCGLEVWASRNGPGLGNAHINLDFRHEICSIKELDIHEHYTEEYVKSNDWKKNKKSEEPEIEFCDDNE